MLKYDDNDVQNQWYKGSFDTLMKRLELIKPSREEMLREISQSGLSITLERGNFDLLTKHKDEFIVTMWKLVKMSEIVNPSQLELLFDQDSSLDTRKSN